MGCCQTAERKPVQKNAKQTPSAPQLRSHQDSVRGKRPGQTAPAQAAQPALLSVDRLSEDPHQVSTARKQATEVTDPRVVLATQFPLFCQKYEVGEEMGTGLGSTVFHITPKLGVTPYSRDEENSPGECSTDAGDDARSMSSSVHPLLHNNASNGHGSTTNLGQTGSDALNNTSPAPPPRSNTPAASPVKIAMPSLFLSNLNEEEAQPHHYATKPGKYCCKVTHASASDEDTKQHFKEIMAYNALTPDDHIVDVVDHFMNESWGVVVLRLVEGGHLVVGERKWSEACVAEIARQVLLLLDDMHASGYAHLDIKPQHILTETLLTESSTPSDIHIRLCGFACCTRFKPGLCNLGEIPESPLYIAPEVWKIVMSEPSATLFDERCDIWSLGVVVYMLLCAKHPFIRRPECNEADYKELFEAIYPPTEEEPIKFPEEAFEGVSNEAKHFLLDLLQIDFRSRSTATQALNHPFIKKHTPSFSYLDHLKQARVMFNFTPERPDVDIEQLKTLRADLDRKQVVGVSPPVSPSGADTARSARRRKSWQEESLVNLIRKDSGGQVLDGMNYDTMSHSQNSQIPTDGSGRVAMKSPKLFMGSPVKHSTATSPHLKPHVLFPKERFSSSSPENSNNGEPEDIPREDDSQGTATDPTDPADPAEEPAPVVVDDTMPASPLKLPESIKKKQAQRANGFRPKDGGDASADVTTSPLALTETSPIQQVESRETTPVARSSSTSPTIRSPPEFLHLGE